MWSKGCYVSRTEDMKLETRLRLHIQKTKDTRYKLRLQLRLRLKPKPKSETYADHVESWKHILAGRLLLFLLLLWLLLLLLLFTLRVQEVFPYAEPWKFDYLKWNRKFLITTRATTTNTFHRGRLLLLFKLLLLLLASLNDSILFPMTDCQAMLLLPTHRQKSPVNMANMKLSWVFGTALVYILCGVLLGLNTRLRLSF